MRKRQITKDIIESSDLFKNVYAYECVFENTQRAMIISVKIGGFLFVFLIFYNKYCFSNGEGEEIKAKHYSKIKTSYLIINSDG